MNDTFPVLYILVRTDLPSMNPGKAIAQGSHASNAFVHSVDKKNALYKAWAGSTTQGFGTVLVLGVTLRQMEAAVDIAQKLGFAADTVVDPTYPYIVPTEQANLIPVETDTAPRINKGVDTVLFRSEVPTAYIFGDKNDPVLSAIVGNFNLHP